MSQISRIAAEQVTRVMNMQKTVNFDAARYFRFLFPSTFLPRPMCIGINIFSLRKRAERIFNRHVIRFVRPGWIFFYSVRKWKRTLDETKLKHFSSITRGRGRQREFRREEGDEGAVATGFRTLPSKSNQPHDVINNATSGIASKRDESHGAG